MDSESSPIPKKKKRLGVSTAEDGGSSQGGGGLSTCGSQPQSSYFNNNSSSNNILAIGQEVNIESRTQPGINKPGGHGTISNIHYDTNSSPKMVDVKYSLGGKESNIELKYVKPHVEWSV